LQQFLECLKVENRQFFVLPHPSFVLRGGGHYPVPIDKLRDFGGGKIEDRGEEEVGSEDKKDRKIVGRDW
jgi:hypothetical protein